MEIYGTEREKTATDDGRFERGRWIPRVVPPEPTEADLLRANVAALVHENARLSALLAGLEPYGISLDSVEVVAEVVDGKKPGQTVTMITGPPDSIRFVSHDRLPIFAEVDDPCCGTVRRRTVMQFDPYPRCRRPPR